MFEVSPPSTFKSDSVDGRNPQQPPGLYKTLKITVDKLPTSTGERRISALNMINPYYFPLYCWFDRDPYDGLL